MNILTQLRREEGCIPHAYQDHLGYWTIGVGRLIDKRRGGGLSDDEIDMLLRNDVERCTREVRAALPWFDTLNEPRRAVLIGMAFQMGFEGLMKFKTTLGLIRDHRFADVPKQMLRSRWASQTPERARRMAEQMRTGEWQT